MGSRREARKTVKLSATLCGVDASGRSFIETAVIRNLSSRGVMLESVRTPFQPGQIVIVRCGENKGRFRVIWVTEIAGQRRKQVGLQHLLSTSLFWDIGIPLPAPDNYVRPRLQVRRQHRRFACELPVELRIERSKTPLWCTTSNVSEGGCFVQVLNIVAAGSKVDVALWIGQVKMWAQGIIVSDVCGFGAGIKFTSLSQESRHGLLRVLSESGTEVQDRRLGLDEELARETGIRDEMTHLSVDR